MIANISLCRTSRYTANRRQEFFIREAHEKISNINRKCPRKWSYQDPVCVCIENLEPANLVLQKYVKA